jgi:hypothetical protein
MQIHYYKCTGDCLEVVAVQQENNSTSLANARCAVCEGRMIHMGIVHRDRLVREEDRTPCNQLCTHAAGPRCDCRCGGENHGTGRVTTVTIEAGVPKLGAYNFDKAVERMREYKPLRMALAKRMEVLNNVFNRLYAPYHLRSRHYIEQRTYRQIILKLRSHFHRIKKGTALLQYLEDTANAVVMEFLAGNTRGRINQGDINLINDVFHNPDPLAD